MAKSNYIILRCHTNGKEMVMDTLIDTNEYELISNNCIVDCWYEFGDTTEERAATRQLVKSNAKLLKEKGIKCNIFMC